jgi:hypothetical protein
VLLQSLRVGAPHGWRMENARLQRKPDLGRKYFRSFLDHTPVTLQRAAVPVLSALRQLMMDCMSQIGVGVQNGPVEVLLVGDEKRMFERILFRSTG